MPVNYGTSDHFKWDRSVRRFPRGSMWRKWDLHVHVPGATQNDGYGGAAGVDRFCKEIEESDVANLGLTDYFSVEAILRVISRYRELYPNSEKVLFPNIELRLPEAVNSNNQIVDIHLLLRPDVGEARARKLMSELKTQLTDGDGRSLRCSELTTTDHFSRATVSRSDIQSAINETFGSVAQTDNVIIVVPCSNNGIRTGGSEQRKKNLAEQIERLADAIFGVAANSEHFLLTNRYADGLPSVPKPVFACSDSHDFTQLTAWLGRTVHSSSTNKEVTWIKADPTFEGLQQTLIEPDSRVRIQASVPDAKEPYKVISSVSFPESPDFPARIDLNPNLVSIIGSRSSGKSALLAHIAHAVDPETTVRQQVATGTITRDQAGPAAGYRWSEVAEGACEVEWGDPAVKSGKVIYIPQNSLYAISRSPADITSKIKPALYRLDEGVAAAHQRMEAELRSSNATVEARIDDWFRFANERRSLEASLRDLGDSEAITSTRDRLDAEIADLRARSELTDAEAVQYQNLMDSSSVLDVRITAARADLQMLAAYMDVTDEVTTVSAVVTAEVRLSPPITSFPLDLRTRLTRRMEVAQAALQGQIVAEIVSEHVGLTAESKRLEAEALALQRDNAALISKNRSNTELEALVVGRKRQDDTLAQVASVKQQIHATDVELRKQVEAIREQLGKRAQRIDEFSEVFHAEPRLLDEMVFEIESRVAPESLADASFGFNRQENTAYFDRSSDVVALERVLEDPEKFLQSLHNGSQKIRRGESAQSLAAKVLTVTAETRFCATLEQDRIGGFEESSMTPGKQSLFALILLLHESREAWPLLIDQPEDDLDSRSIYKSIVPYLASRKKDRQIIMVTHDANLVVGADSEQVIVANRHGRDSKNRLDRTFDYMSGSLEHTLPAKEATYTLDSGGIREHACMILDGGKAAFRKRKDKYKI